MTTPLYPAGFSAVTPYLVVREPDLLIAFMRQALQAEEVICMRSDEGLVRHAAFRVGNAMIEFAQSHADWKPLTSGLHVYVSDVDDTYARAISAGGTSLYEPADMPYGERSGGVADPCGNQWYFATLIEDLSIEELKRRESSKS